MKTNARTLIIFIALTAVLSATSALAIQAEGPEAADILDSPVKDVTTIQQIFINIIGWIYTVFFAVAVLFILVAAYNFVTSSGSEDKVSLAKNQLKYAVIAIVVALVASGVSVVIERFLWSRGYF
jgi:hypothetical protein